MEASTKQMQNNLRNLEKEKQKIKKEEDDLARQYEALRKKNDQLEAKLAREQVVPSVLFQIIGGQAF